MLLGMIPTVALKAIAEELTDTGTEEYVLEFASEEALSAYLSEHGGERLGANMLLVDEKSAKHVHSHAGILSVTNGDAVFHAAGEVTDVPNSTLMTSLNNQTGLENGLRALEAYLNDGQSEMHTVKVAILDTGIDGTHPDLSGRVVAGYDAINDSAIAAGANSDASTTGHGTKVAGILGALWGNSVGIDGSAGVFPIEIIPVRVLDENGDGTLADVIKGINWAVDNGADIINLSFSATLDYIPTALETATLRAESKGILVLAALGNDGDRYYSEQHYPADLKGVVPVTARVKNSSYSYYETPDWANGIDSYKYLYGQAYNAPGFVYATTAKGGGYTTFQGTSACTAYVGGFAAALYSVYGTGESRKLETVKYAMTEAHKYSTSNLYFYPGCISTDTLTLALESTANSAGRLEVEDLDDVNNTSVIYYPMGLDLSDAKGVAFGIAYYDYSSEDNNGTKYLGMGEKLGNGVGYRCLFDHTAYGNPDYSCDIWAIPIYESDLEEINADADAWFASVVEAGIQSRKIASCSPYFDGILSHVNIPGSTVSFYDTFDSLIKQKNNYYDGVVSEWFVYLTREERDTLRLGYSDAGTLFLPHRIYDGDTVKLFYIAGNMLFNVTADKSEKQSFGGADALHAVTLDAASDSVVLANADVYVETPFDYKKIGTTDASGSFTLYATSGVYTLWISDNDTGYMVRKTITVSNTDTTIDLAADIAATATFDVTTRSQGTLGYTVFVSEVGRAGVFSGIVPNDKPIHVTPGTYSVDFALIFPNDAEYVDDTLYHGVNVHLSDALAVSGTVEKNVDYSAFTYTLDLEHRLEMPYCYYEELEIVVEGKDANGYVINGLLNFDKVSVGDMEYDNVGEQIVYAGLLPLSAPWCSFELVDKADPTQSYILTSYGNSLTLENDSIFSETEQRSFTVTFRPAYEPDDYDNSLGLVNPTVFADMSASTEFTVAPREATRTQTGGGKQFIVSFDTFDPYNSSVYYFDSLGQKVHLGYGYNDLGAAYMLPSDFNEGDKIFISTYIGDGIDYNIVEYKNSYATEPYVFTPHTEFTTLLLQMLDDDGEVIGFANGLTLVTTVGGVKYDIEALYYNDLYYDPETEITSYVYMIPSGSYDIFFNTSEFITDEETYETTVNVIMLTDNVTLEGEQVVKSYKAVGEKSFTVDVDYSPKFNISDYGPDNSLTLHFEGGFAIAYSSFPDEQTHYNFITTNKLIAISGERCFYNMDEVDRFSPKTVYAQNTVVDGGRYTFGFTPEKISATLAEDVFTVGEDVLINIAITDSFNNAIGSLWTVLNRGGSGESMTMSAEGIHTPIIARPYPFEGRHTDDTDTSTLIDHLYPVTVYYRAVGASEWSSISTTDYSKATISGLGIGEYEYYVELDFDTYSEEYLTEYASKREVYLNVAQIFNGKLATEISTFSVADNHEHVYGDWTPAERGQHYRECECGDKEYGDCKWNDGEVSREPTHLEKGETPYTCTVCGAEKTEAIDKTAEHSFGEWKPLETTADGHYRECECGETEEKGQCEWNDGEIIKNATHLEEGQIKYTCTLCGRESTETIPKGEGHDFGDWITDPESDDMHYHECPCGEKTYDDCVWDNGEITKNPTHLEEGEKKFTCTLCGREKIEKIDKTTEHSFGEWKPLTKTEDRHYRECECGEGDGYEEGDCVWDNGEVVKKATHLEEGEIKYTCTLCGREKVEKLDKTTEHTFGEWKPEATVVGKHYRECACGEREIEDCEWDDGKITTEPTHYEEGVKTFTCTVCGGEKTESITKTTEHEWGDWAKKDDSSHIRECKCGEIETSDHEFGEEEIVLQPTDNSIHVKSVCSICGYERDVVAAGTVVNFTNCEGLNTNPLTFVQSGDEATFTLKLPTADDIDAREGYKLVGWIASIDGVSYSAGTELFIAYADASAITFTAEWAAIIGTGEQKLAANVPYTTDMDAFELEGEGIIYQGDQVFYVPKDGIYVLIESKNDEEVE